MTTTISCIEDIQHALYINLEKRADRKKHVEKQLKKVGIPATRFNAIKLTNGALGCSMSHLNCIKMAKENNWSHVLVCEDDIHFLDPELFKTQLNTFLKNHTDDWDVVLLAGNNMPPFQQIDVFETQAFGKVFTLDGVIMMTESDEFSYHEMITHVPMITHPNPEYVLVVGGGDGGWGGRREGEDDYAV